MAKVGCPLRTVKFIKHLTFERIVYLDGPGEEIRHAYQGVPQGRVLSPLLFCIYTRNIVTGIPKSVTLLQYADDCALFIKRTSIKSSKNLLEKSIKVINDNLMNLGLELAPQKTKLVHFNNRNIKPGETEVKLESATILSTQSVKFLGVVFDFRLNFKEHTLLTIRKFTRALNIIKFVRGVWWGSDPSTLLIFYKRYFRSILEYASFVYYPTQKCLTQKLEKLQYNAIRLALSYRMSTPTNILLSESKLLQFHDRVKFLGCSYLSKVKSNKSLLVYNSIEQFTKFLNTYKAKDRLIQRMIVNCLDTIAELDYEIISSDHFPVYKHDFFSSIN